MSISRGVRYVAAVCTVALVVLAALTFVHLCTKEGHTLASATAFQKEEGISRDVPRGRKEHGRGEPDRKQERDPRCVDSVHVPSPEEYLLGIAAHTAARRSAAMPLGKESRQKELVLKAASRMLGREGKRAVWKHWDVFLLSYPYRVSSLAHALMAEVSPRFRLSDSCRAEIQAIVKESVERRRKSLAAIRERWPCTASREWFEEHCVRPGGFYTWEFVERHLLSGLPREDTRNDEVFYKTWVYAFELPAHLRPLTMFVNRCCEDVWCDVNVVSGIAELMASHVLETQEMCVSGHGVCEAIPVPSQESLNHICGKMTRIYMDAILRRMNLNVLADAASTQHHVSRGSPPH